MSIELIELASLVLSLGGGALAMVSLYFSVFKRGAFVVAPLRMYQVEPLNQAGTRCIHLTAPMSLANTGAGHKTLSDLRIRVKIGDDDLILAWREEMSLLKPYVRRDPAEVAVPMQPTVFGYSSLSRVYGFTSSPEQGSMVEAIEADDQEHALNAIIEARGAGRSWHPMGTFTLIYGGRVAMVEDYDRING